MHKYFIKLFFRNLLKNKVLSGINIFGFILGLLSTILILEYVFYEHSYDSFHENSERIYRVAYNRSQEGNLLWKTANSFYPTGGYLKEHFEEVEDYFTYQRNYNINISYKDDYENISFNEEKAYYATSSIFNILTIHILKGSTADFNEPNKVAISEYAAKKYFGNENPLGKVITVNHKDNYTVSAIYKSLPTNTHLKTDFLFSLQTLLGRNQNLTKNWDFDYFTTYLLLRTGTDYTQFAQKAFPQMIADNYGKELESHNMTDQYYLQGLGDIHLKSNIEYETEPPGNARALSVLYVFAIFFLVVAWVNYINLTSARAIERAKEVGIKKAVGTSKKSLVYQFVFETFLFNILCILVTIGLFFLINPFFKQLTNIESTWSILPFSFWIYAILIVIAGIFISGIYPALVLTSYKPALILKGKFSKSNNGIVFRKGLVTFQFIVSLILLVGTVVTYKQVSFLLDKDMGVNYRSKLIIKAPKPLNNKEDHFKKVRFLKDRFLQYPEIKDFMFVSDIPGKEIENWFWCYRKGSESTTGVAQFRIDVDNNFTDFFNVKVLAGRGFRENDLPNKNEIIINLKAMERLGFDSPEKAVNSFAINGRGKEFKIIGVVDNFNYCSVKIDAVPTIITNNDGAKSFMALKLASNSSGLLSKFKIDYERAFPNEPFEYFMLDDYVGVDLRTDKTFVKVFSIFSMLAIFIAFIGILGLVIITINQAMKELGVRKVHGANLYDIIRILGRSIIPQYFVSIAIALPVAYVVFNDWVLNSYLYRIDLSWSYFAMPVLFLASLFLVLIFFLSQKVYHTNVVTVLKVE